jgi:hypothetical protein
MDYLALGPHPWCLGADGAYQVHAEFGRRVATAHRQHGVDRAAQRRIQQRGIPAAMDGSHRIEVRRPRCALEQRAALIDFQQDEIQSAGDGRVGQFAAQQGLHDLQPALAGQLLRPSHPRSRAALQPRQHFALLGQPGLERVLLAHRSFLSE